MMHFRTPLALAALAALLSACGGGGGGSSPIPSSGSGSGTQPAQQQTAPAKMVIYIPPASQQNTHFRPTYISAGTQSMTVGLVNGSSTTSLATINLTTGSPNCTVPAGGGLQCTATVQAPFGTDTFVVSTYSQTNAGGSVLSTGQVQATLTLGATEPTVQLDLDGVPSTVSLVLGTATLPVGNAGSTAVIVQAYDASNNLIIGPGVFANPIVLSITGDTYSTLSISYGPSQTNIAAPGQVATLSYNGGTNVGATITASGSGFSPASATFAGSGAVLTIFQYSDTTNNLYGYGPEDVAAFPTGMAGTLAGNAAVVFDDFYSVPNDADYEGIALAGLTGTKQAFVGDTSDHYNPPASGSLTIPGVTVVHGMSRTLETEEFYAYDDLAAGSNGKIYYSGEFATTSAPNCSDEQTEDSGTLGVLDPVAGTTTEYPLEGYPGTIRIDSSGNVWWIEYTGYCGEGSLISGSNYAIGELPAGSGTPIETSFSTAGLSAIGYPNDMSITPNGSIMFIPDGDNATVTMIATATFSGTPVTVTSSAYAPAIATAPDGTTAWFGDDESEVDTYYYGWIRGSSIPSGFSATNLHEAAFPISYYYSDDMSYADGSFWLAGSNEETGIGRISGLSSSAPQNAYYAMPITGEGEDDCNGFQELYSIFAAAGNVWAVDNDCYNIDVMQYGVQSSGTITYNATHRIGTFVPRRNVRRAKAHHAIDPHPRGKHVVR
jgi:hypothetical protein